MKKFVIIFAAMLLLSGCKTKEGVVTVVEHSTDTVLWHSTRLDSIYLHDSIYVNQYLKGDTIYVEKSVWHTDIRERVKTDTVYKSRTDSVPVPYPVIKEVEKKLSKVQKGLMGTGALSLIGIIFFVIYRTKKLLP